MRGYLGNQGRNRPGKRGRGGGGGGPDGNRGPRMDELPQDPHLVATGFFATVHDPAMGEVRFPRSSVRFDGAQVPIGMPPRLGQHTEELLRAAGLDDAQLAALQPSEPSTA